MFISGIDEATADGELADYYASQRAAWGFLPNYAHAFSIPPGRRPSLGRAQRPVRERHGPTAVRDRHGRGGAGPPVDVLHRRALDVPARHLRRRSHDDGDLRAPRRQHARAARPGGLRAGHRGRAATPPPPRREHIDDARAAGLSDADVADVVFAAAARCFFTAVLDGLGTQLDAQTAGAFSPQQLDALVVGRPPAASRPRRSSSVDAARAVTASDRHCAGGRAVAGRRGRCLHDRVAGVRPGPPPAVRAVQPGEHALRGRSRWCP